MGLIWKARLRLDAFAQQAILDLEKAIEEQKRRGIPLPKVAPIKTGELFDVERLVQEMKQGTEIGRAAIEARKRFYACGKSL